MPYKKDDAKPQRVKSQPAPQGGWLRQHWRTLGAIVVVLVSAAIWWLSVDRETAAASTAAQSSSAFQSGPGRPGGASTDIAPLPRDERVAVVTKQLELAERTLCSYRDGTRYPQESRPIAEHPDQIYPNRPIEQVHPMRTSSGNGDSNVQIKTSQTRVFVASGEAVVFTVKAEDKDGKTLPLFVTRAIASAVTARGSRIGAQITLPFADDGSNGDAAAGDGTFSGMLAPAATGFTTFNGTIRTEVKYNVGDQSASAIFDVIYTSETPATWAGPIREALEDGSLNLYLKADVREAGRYMVNGRVDDAKGVPFALVTFNEVLGPGPTEIKLTVFGKLIRDQQPAFPLTLRDVDAYLLKENADPDRALMPRLMGTTYSTKSYAPKSFSDAEWQSEQRSRYLTEFDKDVQLVKGTLAQLDPTKANQPVAPTDCVKVLETK